MSFEPSPKDGKGNGNLGNKRTNGDYLDYIIQTTLSDYIIQTTLSRLHYPDRSKLRRVLKTLEV